MADRRIGRYRLTRKIISGDPTKGIPDLWQAEDAADIYYLKIWTRQAGDGATIQALWNREVRGLMRLQGYPGASELFVRLRDLDANDAHFYAVMDGGRSMLLSDVLSHRNRYHWLLNLSEVGRRRPLWEGILRIAEALSILHAEGTIHRSLSPSSVFVGPDGQGDFRLSGFEWSLRVAGSEGVAAKVGRSAKFIAPELEKPEGEYSTATDWYDFGLMVSELFGVPLKSIKNRSALQKIVGDFSSLRESERELIIRLLEEKQERRLCDAEEITQKVRAIIRDLSSVTASYGRDLVLALRLRPDLEIAKIIEAVSEGKAKASDPIAQKEWVMNDIRGDVRITARASSPAPYYIIKGERLEYEVRAWSSDGLSTWDVAFCESVQSTPRIGVDDQFFSLGSRRIDIQLYVHARRNLRTIRDRSAAWDKVFQFRKQKAQLPSFLRNIHDFFRITQQLDTVVTAAQICPVRILVTDRSANDTTIEVTPFDEPERSDLARYLNLPSPAEQLGDWFNLGAEALTADDDEDPSRDRYSFLERRTIGSEMTTAQWRFTGAIPHREGPRYTFRAQGPVPVREGKAYLARNHGGTITQLRRRHKAIDDLRLYETLLRTLNSPIETTHKSSDPLPDARKKIPLDPSKLDALEALWKTQPSFAIQGPPGTGKTTLITAFADRLFQQDHSAQVLLTAHSHHTVDDVRKKLNELFSEYPHGERPIILRLGGKAPQDDVHDVANVTRDLLTRLRNSELHKRSPDYLQERADDAMSQSSSADLTAGTDMRTMQVLVQDAANLTFSTSNSAELAELADRGRKFDWSIIEEAGKAHGFDMAVALQESHRLLLIGDHHQLPPFNVRLFTDLLGEPLRVRRAIQVGAQFAPGLVDPSIVDEEEGRDEFIERCDQWRRMVRLFESIFEKSRSAGALTGPAATLTDQHRMHPDIAELVGKVFYPDGNGGTILNSPEETHRKFEGDPPFLSKAGSWLPPERIVWCDVPWVQKQQFAYGETDGLFVSDSEVRLVVKILEELRPRSNEPCEIQILSPYNDQIEAIKNAIDREFSNGKLAHLFEKPFDLKSGKRMGATVDEFQGSEADIVIVSLVRNNALVPWKSVGFLKEKNRMNVLLSRARQKLIIVGSWDFFAGRCDQFTNPDEEYAYLGQMMDVIETARLRGKLARMELFK
ncbi:AAA domain-containing protein [Rhizobium leguminosarum]|uniref:AAA domain-containing protein n=1 Tax=Rhizobium leguminosarum TaxID=384 RepID=UPI003F95FAC5